MARQLVIVAGRESLPGTGGRMTRPTALHASVYDYVPSRTVEYAGVPVREEGNQPRGIGASYLIVEVLGDQDVSLSSLVPVTGPGLRCRVVESRDWPADFASALYPAAPGLIDISQANYGPAIPAQIDSRDPVRVVTRPVHA